VSQTTLNWIAAGLFAFAAVANFIVGPLWLAILFLALAAFSVFQALR
jgi:hypothetical protein